MACGFDPEMRAENEALEEAIRHHPSSYAGCDHRFRPVALVSRDGDFPGRWYRCTRCAEAGYEVPDASV